RRVCRSCSNFIWRLKKNQVQGNRSPQKPARILPGKSGINKQSVTEVSGVGCRCLCARNYRRDGALFAQSFVKNLDRNGLSIEKLEQRVFDIRSYGSGSLTLNIESLWLDEQLRQQIAILRQHVEEFFQCGAMLACILRELDSHALVRMHNSYHGLRANFDLGRTARWPQPAR